MANPVRILLIDDHTLFRESVGRLLENEPGFQVVAGCATVAEGLRALDAVAVDVVLLDYDLGDEVGTDLLACIEDLQAKPSVLMVTAGMTASAPLRTVGEGIAGIVLKHSDPRHLVEAVRTVAAGGTWWDAGLPRMHAARLTGRPGQSASVRSVTDRQRQVLRSILDGLTNKEIAARMQASETSVKATIQELFHKAGVRTRGQLVRVAIERYSLDWLKDATSKAAR